MYVIKSADRYLACVSGMDWVSSQSQATRFADKLSVDTLDQLFPDVDARPVKLTTRGTVNPRDACLDRRDGYVVDTIGKLIAWRNREDTIGR